MRRKRTSKAVKRPDLSGLKEALMDGRTWCGLGIVLADDANGSHFEIVDGEVLVDVELQPSEEEITCVVSSPVGGMGVGMFAVPPVGSEVIVALPDGEMDFQPTIVGTMAGESPAGLTGSTIVIVAPTGGEVLVHDGDGVTGALATKADLDALASHVDGHTHAGALGGTGSAPGLTSAPTNSPLGTPSDTSPAAAGTTILKAK